MRGPTCRPTSTSNYSQFTNAVARGRGVAVNAVRNGMGEGRLVQADAAVRAGMIDGVMPTQEIIRKMQGSQGRRASFGRSIGASSVAMAKRSIDRLQAGAAPRSATPALDRIRREIDMLEW